ncbi:MAG: hypothetical protein HY913_10335 [Desulfomonile tiedjei]|nr:hypothetical protein [Desulfomonile tiedjei]
MEDLFRHFGSHPDEKLLATPMFKETNHWANLPAVSDADIAARLSFAE